MCQSKTHGNGKRCVESSATKEHRKLAQRLKRAETSGKSQAARELSKQIASLHAGREKYGPFVTPMVMNVPQDVVKVMDDIRNGGSNPLLVGGTVRDVLMNTEPKDFDIEVYGIDIDDLARKLRRSGYNVNSVGKQFGVLKVRTESGDELDISVPREDSRAGDGHRGVEVSTDINMSVAEAAERRDFTMNAMMYDHDLKVAIDPHKGAEDLKNNVLRHVSEKFADDPLRPLRGFQFAARYGMVISPETAELCRSIADRATEIPQERIVTEWEKFYRKGKDPGAGFKALKDIGWDKRIPGMDGLTDDEELVNALSRAQKNVPSPEDREAVMASLIIKRIPEDSMKRSFTHYTLLGSDQQRTALETASISINDPENDTELRQVARNLKKGSLRLYAETVRAEGNDAGADEIIARATRLGVLDHPQEHIITGGEIIEMMNKPAGPWVGILHKKVIAAQDRGEFFDLEGAKEWISTHSS